MKDYLTDAQVARVEAFCRDKEMFEAVKLVLLQQLYTRGVISKGVKHDALHNRALTLVQGDVPDAELGSRLRALWEGVQGIESGFVELEKIKSEVTVAIESPFNPAE